MRKFARTLMVTLTALCLSVCFLFAGCSKQAGTYIGTTLSLTGDGKAVELKLKANDEFEMSVGSGSKTGTWKVSEDDENVIIFVVDGNEVGKATYNEENKTIKIGVIGDVTLTGATGATLSKK